MNVSQTREKRVGFNSLFLRGRDSRVTCMDIIKSAALVLMVMDHVGVFFFPDHDLWRAFGRICLPLWFCLAGYQNPSTPWDKRLFIGGLIVCLGYAALFGRIWPLNALFTVLAIRVQGAVLLQIQPVWLSWPDAVRNTLLGVYVLLLALLAPYIHVWEYGTLALLLGLAGFFRRHPSGLPPAGLTFLYAVIGLILISAQQTTYHFTGWAMGIAIIGMSAALAMLRFAPLQAVYKTYNVILRVLGRFTLEFYVMHLLLFMLIYKYLHV